MKTPLIILALLLSALPASGAGSGGSAYSLFGIGDIRYLPGNESAGRGYTGIGYASPATLNPLAPATWSRIARVRLDLSVLYEGFNSSDGQRSLYRAAATFNGATLALPVSTDHGIVVAGGFVPYSNISFNSFTSGSEANVAYVVNHVGSGGLGRGFLGLSYAPADWLSVGATMDYLFGSLEREERLSATPPSGQAAITSLTTRAVTTSGFTGTAGVRFSGFERIAPELEPLTLGFTITPGTSLTSRTTSTYVYSGERDTTDEVEGTLGIPLSYAAGVTWKLSDRTILLADYAARQWAATKVNGASPQSLRNSRMAGIGVERLPSPQPGGGWWDRISLRAGAAYAATYFSVDGTGIDEWAVTAGAGLPFFGDARLHLAAEYAWRGGTEQGLIRDRIIRVSASLSLSELWFVRYEEE